MEKLLTFMNTWLGKLYIQNKYVPLDKFMHFLSGAILGIILYPFIGWLSIIVVSLIAYAKERYDAKHKDKHTPDIWDWVATSLGGMTVLFIIHNVSYWS